MVHHQPSFFYEYSGQGILASSDFYDNPFGLRGEDNSLRNNFYNDTRQDKDMAANFNLKGLYILEDEVLILSDTDSQLGVIPEIQFYWQEAFNSPTNYFYDDSREDIFFYDNLFDLYSELSGIDGVNTFHAIDLTTPYTESDSYSASFTAIAMVAAVPEPSSIIGLAALSVFGLVNRCTSKKNKRNNKNNLRKPETIPPVSNLDFIVDDSTNNKGNG